jgi:hypothetical protein
MSRVADGTLGWTARRQPDVATGTGRFMQPRDPLKKKPCIPLIPAVNFAQFHGKPKISAAMSWARALVRRMNEAP